MNRRIWLALCTAMLAALTGPTALAQDTNTWPEQPITLIVPFAAGGGTDSIAREFATELGQVLKQTIVVENRGGGGGSIGAARVAQAKPNGYTLLFATSTFATNAAWEKSKLYDPIKDFTPIALLGSGPLMLVANRDLGLADVNALLTKAKNEPGAVNYCSAGPGSINHLSGALFTQRTGVEMSHVPYRGSGPAALDLMAGRVQVFFSTMPTMLEQVKANKVKLLALTSKTRSPLFPEVPTLQESGVKDFDINTWWGVLGPADLPEPVVQKLNEAANKVATGRLISNRLTQEGATVKVGPPAQFAKMLAQELAMWRSVVDTIPQK